MIMNLPKRKNIRLKNYDYSSNGMYFITICCKDRINYLGEICNRTALLQPIVKLSDIGEMISEHWYKLINRYENMLSDKFVVMPNHIHGIIVIDFERAKQSPAPTIGDIICTYKSITTKLANKNNNSPGRTIWQRGYYEHIIRYENEYQKIWEYIDSNPLKWQEDCFYL